MVNKIPFLFIPKILKITSNSNSPLSGVVNIKFSINYHKFTIKHGHDV
jgi:hypothetical protein